MTDIAIRTRNHGRRPSGAGCKPFEDRNWDYGIREAGPDCQCYYRVAGPAQLGFALVPLARTTISAIFAGNLPPIFPRVYVISPRFDSATSLTRRWVLLSSWEPLYAWHRHRRTSVGTLKNLLCEPTESAVHPWECDYAAGWYAYALFAEHAWGRDATVYVFA